jgi:single-strand DNA-binding protein
MNVWSGTGRLTRDPETRTTNSGKTVCTFAIAVRRRYTQEGKPDAVFLGVECWSQNAEYASNYLSKGRLIALTGELLVDHYEDHNGDKRTKTYVRADRVEALDRPSDRADDAAPTATATPASNSDDEYDPFADE